MSVVQGICESAFKRVHEEFEKNFAERGELGASICVSVNGGTVLDLWGGVANKATGEAWETDTLTCIFSNTKAMTAMCAHMLIDQGKLNPAMPVTDIWPEFGQNGKDKVTVQMMLNHETGVAAYRDPVKPDGFLDWDYMIERTAAETPWWEPGTRNGYHMISFGWTVGEIVRRVSGQSLGAFFREHIAEPCGAHGSYIGLPLDADVHYAPIEQYAPKEGEDLGEFVLTMLSDPDSLAHKSFLNTGGWWPNERKNLAAEIGGAGGVSNARNQARIWEVVACGGQYNGVTLFSPERVKAMGITSVATSRDATLLAPTRFANGFMKSMDSFALPGGDKMSAVIGEKAFGHVGAGGSIGFADPECGLAFSYNMNQMGAGLMVNDRGQALIDAVYETLGYTRVPGAWVQ